MECRVLRLLKKSTAVKGRVGLAFGPSEVAVAVMRRDSGAPVLERCEILPVDPAGGAGAIAAVIRAAGLPRMPVSTVLRSDDYQLALVEAPDVPPAELRAAMRWRLKEAIDFRVARRSAVDRHAGAVVGVATLDVVDVPELCLRNLAALLPGAAAGVALLYLGETALSIVLVRGRTFYFARQMAPQTPPRPTGHPGGHSGSLPGPTAPEIESVVLELQRSLDYYERHFDQPPITRIAVSPAGTRASELARELGRDTGFEVATLDLNLLLHCAAPVEAAAQASCLLAVGAALREEQRSL